MGADVERLLPAYLDLLRRRGIRLGLIAEGDGGRIRERHVDDSLRAAPLIRGGDVVCDIGSGAGLPGIPLAIACPDARFVLVESRRKAVAFLELVVERLGLSNVDVDGRRVEDVEGRFDVATARAFAPIERSWTAACRVLRPGGRLIYFGGASLNVEAARSIRDPEPPTDVNAEVDSSGALVIMSRRE